MKLAEFRNQSFTDFSQSKNRRAMEEAVAKVRSEFGKEYDIRIGGELIRCEGKFQSLNPSHKDEVIGVFQKGTSELVDRAVAAAQQAFPSWSQTDVEQRVERLLRVSEMMQAKRLELAAWMVVEVGKSWLEADADVAEGIDFAEFYAREMLRLAGSQPLVRIESEDNELRYIPLGVGIIIPPWNFPLAILGGMTFAALVSGNTVVVKPSSDSPAIAAQLVKILEEAEFPPGVVNFLTGSGEEIGDALITHVRTRFIAFTGSKEVGLRINELAARTRPKQIWIKRVIAEMGGKDTIVVDDDVDLDDAAADVVAAAFGFQGQKCSACSRAVVLDSVYDAFLEKISEKTGAMIEEGNVEEAEVNFGPVINQGAHESILKYIEAGKREGRLLMGGESGSSDGYFIRPTIFADIDPKATISQEEIFGPVLAVIRAGSYDEAVEIANNTEYGLTGSVYTRNESRIAEAEEKFHVGNLYINRKCTGALVGVHPFGGFNMSGTDSKAGGRDYLLLFTQAKVTSRKLVDS